MGLTQPDQGWTSRIVSSPKVAANPPHPGDSVNHRINPQGVASRDTQNDAACRPGPNGEPPHLTQPRWGWPFRVVRFPRVAADQPLPGAWGWNPAGIPGMAQPSGIINAPNSTP